MAEIELKTAPADFRFPTTNQSRHCFIGAWQQRGMDPLNVRNLPNTIVPCARVNGLIGGMSRGKIVYFQDPFNLL